VKGAIIFLLTLVVAGTVAVLTVLPVYRERADLERRLLDGRGSRPMLAPEARLLATGLGEIEKALGNPAADPAAALIRVTGELAPEAEIEGDAETLTITLSWDLLPGLISKLAGPDAPPLSRLTAKPAETPELCVVTVVVEGPAQR
jgi:hypothetical protein